MTRGLIFTYGCLLPLILIDVVYIFQEKRKGLNSSFYRMLITVDILMIISEVASSYLLFNSYNLAIGSITLRFHWMFGILLFFSMFLYAYCIIKNKIDLTYKNLMIDNKIVLVITITTIIICLLYLTLPLPKLDYSELNYLPGWLAYALIVYAVILISIVVITYILSKNKTKEDLLLIGIMAGVSSLYVVAQYLFPNIALGPLGASFIIISFYIAIENPSKVISNEMKKYTHVLEEKNDLMYSIITNVYNEANNRVNETIALCSKHFNAPVMNREEVYKDLEIMTGDIKDLSFVMNNRIAIISSERLLESNSYEFDVLETINRFYKFAIQKKKKESVKLSIEIDDGIPKKILGDEDAFYYLLTNAFTSAYKNTEVGRITIKIRKTGDKTININVVDTGEGRSKEEYANIENVDVNFIIIKKYLSLYNGRYTISGELNLGSTLDLFLEINPTSEEFVQKQVIDYTEIPMIPLIDMQRKKVLLVENNEINTLALSQLLNLYNVDLKTTTSVNFLTNDIKQGIKYDYILIDTLVESNSIYIAGSILKLCDDFELEKPKIIALTPFKTKKFERDHITRGYAGCLTLGIDIEEFNKILK